LYVANASVVEAFPLGATDPATPSWSLTGLLFSDYATTATSASNFRSSVACPDPLEQTSIITSSVVGQANGAID
jgi:hypothetical protein